MIILRYHEIFFRLTAPRCPGMAAGAVSLKLPNFLTTSQDVTKGADQAKCDSTLVWRQANYSSNLKL